MNVLPRPRCVLVVDDNIEVADTLACLLQMTLRCDVVKAYDGQAAIDLAVDWHPDIVIMDIAMPDMDGAETARVLKQMFSKAPPRFIAVTGLADYLDRENVLAAGFEAYVPKPVDITRLLSVVGV
jgi:CheY-like chemotaxis protein